MNEHKANTKRQILALALALAAILLLASGLPDLQFEAGEPLHLYAWLRAALDYDADLEAQENSTESQPLPSSSNLSEWSLAITFWIFLLTAILFAIISPQYRRELLRWASIVLALMLIMPRVVERLNPPEMEPFGQGAPGELPLGDSPFPEPPPFIQQPPDWLLTLVGLLLLVLFLVGIFLVWRWLRRKPDPKTVMVANIRHALSEIESGSEFKDVVVACYAKMCRELQRSQGIQRHTALTPREFETTLSQSGINSHHIGELTRLFEGARYGFQGSDPSSETRAIASLQAILKVYGE